MKVPSSLEELRKMLEAAIKLEIGTPAGKINFWGMFLAIVLIALGTLTGLIEDFIRMYRPKAVSGATDFMQMFLIYAALIVVCVVLVSVDDKKRRSR